MVRMRAKPFIHEGHSENNLRQINTFFIDFDIHYKRNYFSKRYFNNNIDLGFYAYVGIKSDKGYQAYFVLETPVYVTSKSILNLCQSSQK